MTVAGFVAAVGVDSFQVLPFLFGTSKIDTCETTIEKPPLRGGIVIHA